MRTKLKLSLFQTISLITLCGVSLLSFQNCSGFKVAKVSTSDLGSLGVRYDGKALYSTNCSACHGGINSSAKANRTAGQISEAIQTIPQMAALQNLSSGEISAISDALSVQAPSSGIQLKFQCANPENRGAGEKRMRKMTRVELVNTLNDLVGSDIISNSAIQTQISVMPSDTPAAEVTEVPEVHGAGDADALFTIANLAAELIGANTTARNRVFGTCSGQTINDACAQAFITNFGLKAYRRPLTSIETASVLASYKKTGGLEGLKRALIRLMTSPSMAFHIEFGGATTANRTRLTDFEIASRISYRLLGTMPDSLLLDAASKGELQSLASVRAHVQRLLLNNPLAKARIEEFFRFYLQLAKVSAPSASAGTLRQIDVNGLREEMIQESVDFINHGVWTKKGSFKSLLTSNEVFPRSDRMATILETSKATGNTPSITSAAHAGIILRPALMSASGERTNPIRRAVLIRKRLLCQNLGAPDPQAVAQQTAAAGDVSGLSNRAAFTKVTNAPQCLGCHNQLNPVGFALENYDQLGMWRTTETVMKNGAISATFPIDTKVGDPMLGGPTSLADADDLVKAIADGNGARSCFAEMVFEYQRMRSYDEDDSCALREVETASLEGGTMIEAFTSSIANEDIFWKAKGN